jgi:Virulence activator alpha C-term
VTDAGRSELSAWIAQPVDMAPIKDDLLVKIFAGYLVPEQTILAELAQHQIQHQERLQVYTTLEQKFFSRPEQLTIADRFRYITLRNGIRYETEWLAWCEEAIAFLGAEGNQSQG